ncbi:hypothetical protein DYB30_008943 [Aphanomyces astaci]|uniref:Uncharacterized protein n=1 Tax=Aphanomyces astaci TaxID=112090 RepID=A0A397ELJ8_APHAT|nr:hypothetical protein DYB30_008943 [Aphanomyces astaci]RHY61192.1 hypothetical protein DYB38_000833 [Aphanomyces astaci]RHY86108.1 hypothetical protein DYB31_001572 [Aphanomyces astaci]
MTGTADMLLVKRRGLASNPLAGVMLVIDIKKGVQPSHSGQALGQLVSASPKAPLHCYPMSLLTDLNKHWEFTWFNDDHFVGSAGNEYRRTRDVAKEMVHELRRQLELQQKRERVVEHRALTAELRRHQFEVSLKQCRHHLQHLEANVKHHIVSILLGGLLGALFGWLVAIILIVVDTPTFVAMFLMGPFVAGGAIFGVGLGLATRQRKLLAVHKRIQHPVVSAKSTQPPAKRTVLRTAMGCAKDALFEYMRS